MNYQVAIAPLKLNWFKKQGLKKIIYKNLKRHMYCLGDMKSTYHTNALLHELSEFSFFETELNLFSQKILNRNIRICSMWANVGSHGSKVSLHNHIKDDYKYIHRNVSAPTKIFNYGFNNCDEEYIIKGITKKEKTNA